MSFFKVPAFFLGLVFSSAGLSQPALIPMPKSTYTPNAIFADIREPLRKRLDELPRNYKQKVYQSPQIPSQGDISAGFRVVYFSPDERDCYSDQGLRRAIKDAPLTTIEFIFRLNATKTARVESLKVFGCGEGKPLIEERVATTGTNLEIPDSRLTLTGTRKFQLGANETTRIVDIYNLSGVRLLSQNSQRSPDGTIVSTFSGWSESDGQLRQILEVQERPGTRQSTILYKIPESFTLNVSNRLSRSRSTMNGNPHFGIQVLDNGQVSYFFSRQITWLPTDALSFDVFQKRFSGHVIGGLVDILRSSLDLFVSDLPKTELISAGTKSGRVFEEFAKALNDINSNNTQPVKEFLMNYLEYIDKGLIVIQDKRP